MTPYKKQMEIRQHILKLQTENHNLKEQIEDAHKRLEELLHKLQSRL